MATVLQPSTCSRREIRAWILFWGDEAFAIGCLKVHPGPTHISQISGALWICLTHPTCRLFLPREDKWDFTKVSEEWPGPSPVNRKVRKRGGEHSSSRMRGVHKAPAERGGYKYPGSGPVNNSERGGWKRPAGTSHLVLERKI